MLVFGVATGGATGGASLPSQKLLVRSAKSRVQKQHRLVDMQLLRHLRAATWRWQTTMGRRRSPVGVRPRTVGTLRSARRAARNAYVAYLNPPHKREWLCIHRYEGSWKDDGAPYYGGLQMDLGFQSTYGRTLLQRKGTANHWTPLEQMWVAERAYRSGRGFYPWPNTARMCGLI